ncbi:putative flavin-containing monooxygenase 1 [Vitis vinifera]|uniref:Putative flavin-containing monooxygenase 1 n=1 Tax=Vitis vinifera TaxID=29760 RepID=A0A438IIX6_VITVI|nr:putative flavin-containing monooxygenase 1 [Vitis vinifera]
MERKVGIIGAGISGLLACKYTLSKGYTPVVFESGAASGDPMSIILACSATSNSTLKSSASPMKAHRRRRCRHGAVGGAGEPFGSKGKWNLTVNDTHNLSTELMFKYMLKFTKWIFLSSASDGSAMCLTFQNFPAGKGPEMFHGKVIHSMEYAAMDFERAAEFIKGKRTTVVGFQKHALDIAMECSTANGGEHPCRSCTRRSTGLSRITNHGGLLATILSPVRWGFSKFVESYIKRKLSLEKFGMVPKHSFLNEISSCLISTLPEGFYDRVEEGSILLKKAPKFGFCKKELDYIIGSPTASLPLYRECIHPRIPQLAVIGFSESVSNLYTSEMRCRWVAELLDGNSSCQASRRWRRMQKDGTNT